MATDHEYYRDRIKAMLPPGAFALEAGQLPADICSALAKVLAQGQERGDQAQLEALPHTAEECLAEWEAMMDAPAAAGATDDERRAALVGLWRLAAGMNLLGIRAVLEPALGPEYQFTDTMDDEDLSWRFDVRAGNVAITETALHQQHDTGINDCRWDAANKLAGLVLLEDHDREDDVWICAEVKSSVMGGADCAGGLVFYLDGANAFCFGPYRDGLDTQLRIWCIAENVVLPNQDYGVAPATPYWLIGGREDDVFRFYAEPALPSPFSVVGLTPVAEYSTTVKPRHFGIACKNGGGPAASTFQWEELRQVYREPHNNVEIIETPGSLATSPENIYFAFVHRQPGDDGNYDIATAQRLADKAKPAHAVLFLGESDCFRCDDPYSLTDRDVLGS